MDDQSTVLAVFDDEFEDPDVDLLRQVVTGLGGRRRWSIAPPEFIDERAGESRTVGASLRIRAATTSGLRISKEEDRRTYEDVLALVEALADVSRAAGVDIGFELDGDSCGWLNRGEPDRSLRLGLLEEWRRATGD